MQCVTFCRRSIVQYEHRSDWTLPQIVVQCENNGDSMILKIMQCELGIRDTIIKKKQPQIYQPTYIVKYFQPAQGALLHPYTLNISTLNRKVIHLSDFTAYLY